MEQTDACRDQSVCAEQILENIRKINKIEYEDLSYLESDLDFDDKVSLMFLLYGGDRVQSKVLLQQLIVKSFDPTRKTAFLKSWAINNETVDNHKWRDTLLEALCIIQAKYVIRRLGLDYDDLQQRFLPSNLQSALFIHPIVKLLYHVCERLTIDQARSLIEHMLQKYPSIQDFNYRDGGEYLEIYMMFWILEDVISIGSDNRYAALPCNLEPIVEFLKQIEMDTLKEAIKEAVHKFNCEQLAQSRPNSLHKNQTDDKRSDSVEVVSRSFEERLQTVDTSNSYQIKKSNAGIALIINQKSFYRDTHPDLTELLPKRALEVRHGTDKDKEALEATFSAFGYKIVQRENLTHTNILNAVRDTVNQCVRMDSIVVCILSHGYKGIVYGSNSIPVKIEEIEGLIISDRLLGKPKIFIVQACQGEETQQAREFDFLRHDGPTSSLPLYSDLLSCISTVPGFTSIRHIEQGSWFIQTLCKKLNDLADRKHFVDILTVVCREVLNKRGRNNQCMVPIYHSTLRMDLFLPSK